MIIFSIRFYVILFLVPYPLIGALNTDIRAQSASTAASSLSREVLTIFAQVDEEATSSRIASQVNELNTFVEQLRRKQAKYRSEKRFLSYFFWKVHRQFLKNYRSHTTLYQLLEQGEYDCVTGTALYALLLHALDIPYQVHEFPYHVYLTVTTSKGETVMIESTDPQHGLVTNPREQAQRQQHYSQTDKATDQETYQYQFAIQEQIGLTELAGLSYFNEAVEYYNQKEFQQAAYLLRKAHRLYDSPRMDAFQNLLSRLAQN